MNKVIQLILSLAMMTGIVRADALSDKETEAIVAAQQWLSLCDQNKHDESWEAAASFFRKAVTKGQWEQVITAVRAPLGKMMTRDVKSKNYQTSIPGAPDGEYVIIQFNTAFENKNETVETVTMMLDQDRGWRASGYFIK